MTKILSQEEIDALLSSINKDELQADETSAPKRRAPSKVEEKRKLFVYNFRRPDRISKDQIRSIHYLHDRFARSFSSSLSAYLRALTEVNLVSVEQLTYAEFILSLPDPTYFNAISMKPLEGNSIIEINPSIVFPMIDKLLGGVGEPFEGPMRAITDIEMEIINGVLNLVLRDLRDAWKQVVDIDFKIAAQETSPQLIQIVAPNEVVVLIVFEIKVGEASGMMNFCIPSIVLEPVAKKFSQDWYVGRKKITENDMRKIKDILSEATFRVDVDIDGNKIIFSDLLELEKGDLIVLETDSNSELTLKIGGVPKFKGKPVKIGKKKGFKINSKIKRFEDER